MSCCFFFFLRNASYIFFLPFPFYPCHSLHVMCTLLLLKTKYLTRNFHSTFTPNKSVLTHYCSLFSLNCVIIVISFDHKIKINQVTEGKNGRTLHLLYLLQSEPLADLKWPPCEHENGAFGLQGSNQANDTRPGWENNHDYDVSFRIFFY